MTVEEMIINGIKVITHSPEDNKKKLQDGEYSIRALLYGRSGTGKSRMSSTFPGKKGVIDTDNGDKSYTNTTGECIVASIMEDSVIDKVKPVAWETAMAALTMFVGRPDIDCIIIDSFTTLADACMKHIMFTGGRTGQPPSFVEWSKQMDLLREFLFKAFGSGKNVIGVFHEHMDKDELSGQVWCLPLITGKMAAKVPNFFDEVYHMEPKDKGGKTVYEVRTKASRMYVAKSRLDTMIGLEDVITADFGFIKNKIDTLTKVSK